MSRLGGCLAPNGGRGRLRRRYRELAAARIAALREFIDYVKAKPGVWLPTREQIARWYLGEAAGHMKRR